MTECSGGRFRSGEALYGEQITRTMGSDGLVDEGFGSFHFAKCHPQDVSFVSSVIKLLDFPRVQGLLDGQRLPVDAKVFGDDASAWIKESPSHHLVPSVGEELVIVMGKQAFDRTMNENFIHLTHVAGSQPEISHRRRACF
jgi:hypothetical protein